MPQSPFGAFRGQPSTSPAQCFIRLSAYISEVPYIPYPHGQTCAHAHCNMPRFPAPAAAVHMFLLQWKPLNCGHSSTPSFRIETAALHLRGTRSVFTTQSRSGALHYKLPCTTHSHSRGSRGTIPIREREYGPFELPLQ